MRINPDAFVSALRAENDDLDLPPETLEVWPGGLCATVSDGDDDDPVDQLRALGLIVGACAVVGVAAYGIWQRHGIWRWLSWLSR